jgi:hypothetical protein
MSIKTRLAKLESKQPVKQEPFQFCELYGIPPNPNYVSPVYPPGHVWTMNELFDDITLQNSMKN